MQPMNNGQTYCDVRSHILGRQNIFVNSFDGVRQGTEIGMYWYKNEA